MTESEAMLTQALERILMNLQAALTEARDLRAQPIGIYAGDVAQLMDQIQAIISRDHGQAGLERLIRIIRQK